MNRRNKAKTKKLGQGGQALAEFALCLPIILIGVFGLIQIAAMGYATILTKHAAQCAARTFSVRIGSGMTRAQMLAEASAGAVLKWGRLNMPFRTKITPYEATADKAGSAQPFGITHNFKGEGPLRYFVSVELDYPLFLKLPGTDGHIRITGKTFTYSEANLEFDREKSKL